MQDQAQPKANEFFNIRRNIRELVSTFPKLKENYNELIVTYWMIYDNVQDLTAARKATPVETITRQFRKLVERGEIL